MCSESFWFQETSNRHSWKYRRFRGSHQGKCWHPWVARVSIIHSIPGCLKSQKQLVCSSKSLWGTNVAFIKNVLPLTHLSRLPFLSIRLWEHCSHRRFHIKLRVHVQDRVGELRDLSSAHNPTCSIPGFCFHWGRRRVLPVSDVSDTQRTLCLLSEWGIGISPGSNLMNSPAVCTVLCLALGIWNRSNAPSFLSNLSHESFKSDVRDPYCMTCLSWQNQTKKKMEKETMI